MDEDRITAELAVTAAVVRREFLQLAVLVVAAGLLFLGTRTFATTNRALRRTDAAEWFARGERQLSDGAAETASAAFRRAVALDPAAPCYHLALARALAQAGRDADARSVLLSLRQVDPESANTNLELARLEARAARAADAVRYYQTTLAALWPEADSAQRRAVRLELVEFLLRQQQRSRALAELLVLNADAPAGPAASIRMGRLFLEAGDARRAAARFAEVLATAPRDAAALAGAGDAAFELRDYAQALRFYDAGGPSAAVAERRSIASLVLTRAPLAPRLGTAARLQRLTQDARDTGDALDACTSSLSEDHPQRSAVLSARDAVAATLTDMTDSRARPATRHTDSRRAGALDDLEDALVVQLGSLRSARAAGCPDSPFAQALERIGQMHGLVTP